MASRPQKSKPTRKLKRKAAPHKRTSPVEDGSKVRLQVLLARCGFGSRRNCEELIENGRVAVDGQTVTTLGMSVDPKAQEVLLDGESLRSDKPAYYMVNKPKGVLCTNADPAGRARVIDLFPKTAGRLFPVGRLDENSVGLLLVTNDGELSHRLAHPRFRVPKVYRVQVAGTPTGETLKSLREGMYFSDGRFKVEHARKISTQGKSTILEVKLREGQNREIRRLFARVGHKVMKLERVEFGPLKLRSVAVGRFRPLTSEEVRLLKEYVEADRGRQEEKALAESRRETEKDVRKKEPAERRPRRVSRMVEVSPVELRGGRDITGRLRGGAEDEKPASRFKRGRSDRRDEPEGDLAQQRKPRGQKRDFDEDDRESDGSGKPHPAIVRKPVTGVKRPIEHNAAGGSKSKGGSRVAGGSKSSSGSKSTSGNRPAGGKKKVTSRKPATSSKRATSSKQAQGAARKKRGRR
jgi:23S rRNA pseudouridine2605 synthase